MTHLSNRRFPTAVLVHEKYLEETNRSDHSDSVIATTRWYVFHTPVILFYLIRTPSHIHVSGDRVGGTGTLIIDGEAYSRAILRSI